MLSSKIIMARNTQKVLINNISENLKYHIPVFKLLENSGNATYHLPDTEFLKIRNSFFVAEQQKNECNYSFMEKQPKNPLSLFMNQLTYKTKTGNITIREVK